MTVEGVAAAVVPTGCAGVSMTSGVLNVFQCHACLTGAGAKDDYVRWGSETAL
jgi:hypothetical protein